jgi:arabinan endo-1,5-alpha-L-arabinosidase
MKLQALVLVCTAGLCVSTSAQSTQPASTVAYWRFESATAGRAVSPERVIEDVSGNGNHLRTFDPGAAPTFVETTPWKFVPHTRRANRIAIDNTARPERPFPTRDLFLAPENSAFDLVKGELPTWTIEASVNFKPTDGWERRFQTFVCREGYNVPKRDALHEDPLANLGFKKRGDTNCISIEAFDSTGTYVTVQSKTPVKADTWYDVAAVSDGKTLKLYMKGADDKEMVLHGEQPFHGALANGGEGWTVGRGAFAFNPSEQMFGLIDEVRISNGALTTDRFLASPASGAAKTDEEFGPPTTRSATQAAASAATTPAAPASLIHPHDPVLVKDGDTFHVFASHGGLSHWRSKNLVNWESVPSVMKSAPDWSLKTIAPDPGIWAPEVAFFNGRWHVYYSLSRFGSQRSAIALKTGKSLNPDDPAYGWTDEGAVLESQPGMDFNAIDPAFVTDAQGNPWLSWGSFNKGIYLSKIDAGTGKLLGEPIQIAARPGNTALEAPHLFYREGYYYLVVSYDFCCRGARSTYKLVVGRSKEITGPYMSREGKPMLEGEATLLMRSHDFVIGPGQSSTVEHGGKWILAHHYYDVRRNGEPTLAVRDLYFDHEGWPLLGEPYAELSETDSYKLEGRYRVQLDYADVGEMEFKAGGTITSVFGTCEPIWMLTERRWMLRFKGEFARRSAECFVSRDGRALIGRTDDGQILRLVRAASSESR